MLDKINEGEDLHKFYASVMHGCETNQVTKEWRQEAKAANFGFPGGLGTKTFIQFSSGYGLEISESEAMRMKDAWHAAFVGPDQLREEYQEVRRYAEEAGRDPDSVALTLRTRLPLKDAAKAVEHIERLREVGVSHIVVEIFTVELGRARELMDVLAKEVRPKAGA